MHSIRIIHSNSSLNDIQVFLGLILAIASTGAMVMTLQSLMQGWQAKTLSVAAGIALQGCLYLFANNSNHRIRWFSWLLLAFSVVASTWFMESTWKQQQNHTNQQNRQQANQSWQAEQIRYQIAELNRQIEISLNSADTDTNTNYRERGKDTLLSLEGLKQARDRMLDELKELQQTPQEMTEKSVFEELTWLRLTLFSVTALIIDVSAILAFRSLTLTEVRSKKYEPLIDQPLLVVRRRRHHEAFVMCG